MNKILIIKTHAIGDVLMTTPALRSLRTSFLRAEISVLVGNWSAPILKNNSYITRLIEFEDDIVHKKKIINLIKIVLILRSYKFDTAIIFHPSPFIHLIAMCAGIKKRYGLCRHGKSFFLTSSIEENGSYDFYYPQNFLNVLVKIGIKSKDTKMNVFSTPGDFNSVKELLFKKGVIKLDKLILIAPGGASNPKEKIAARLWPVSYFIILVRKIIRDFPEYTIVFSGAENDIAITAQIHGEIPNTIDLAGETNIQELVCLVEISRAIICNDSSVLHIGIAQNRPTIGIFGPTSLRSRVPEIQIPNSIQSSEKCSPCNHYGKFLGCKENGKCMNAITPEIVFRKVKDILNIFK